MSDILKSAMDKTDYCGVRNLRGPFELNHGEQCEGCQRIAADVREIQAHPLRRRLIPKWSEIIDLHLWRERKRVKRPRQFRCKWPGVTRFMRW